MNKANSSQLPATVACVTTSGANAMKANISAKQKMSHSMRAWYHHILVTAVQISDRLMAAGMMLLLRGS